LGFEVVDIPNETIEEILQGIRKVGEALNRLEAARQLIQNIEDTLQLVSNSPRHLAEKIPAVLIVGRKKENLSGLYLAGGRSYLSEIWSRCGGENVFRELEMKYFSVNLEDLLAKDIRLVLEFHPEWNLDKNIIEKQKMLWTGSAFFDQLSGEDIYIFQEQFYLIPGPRITRIAISFQNLIRDYMDRTYD
jgi:ABC-type Fe3+-hydroxamate transport system substrate-binding protein